MTAFGNTLYNVWLRPRHRLAMLVTVIGNGLGYDLDCLNGESLGLGGLSGLGLSGLCSANPLTFWCSSSGTFSKTEDLVVGE